MSGCSRRGSRGDLTTGADHPAGTAAARRRSAAGTTAAPSRPRRHAVRTGWAPGCAATRVQRPTSSVCRRARAAAPGRRRRPEQIRRDGEIGPFVARPRSCGRQGPRDLAVAARRAQPGGGSGGSGTPNGAGRTRPRLPEPGPRHHRRARIVVRSLTSTTGWPGANTAPRRRRCARLAAQRHDALIGELARATGLRGRAAGSGDPPTGERVRRSTRAPDHDAIGRISGPRGTGQGASGPGAA